MSIRKTLQTWIAGPHKDALPYPKFLQLESKELTDFGQQVVTLMQMKPDSFTVMSSLREFYHPQLGSFAYDKSNHLHHRPSDNDRLGQLREPGRQRLLTRGDSWEIAAVLHWLLRRPMSLDEAKSAGGAVGPPKQAADWSSKPIGWKPLHPLGGGKIFDDQADAMRYALQSRGMANAAVQPPVSEGPLDATMTPEQAARLKKALTGPA